MTKFILLTLSLTAAAHAATVATPDFIVSTTIPDNNSIGIADTRAVTSPITSISGIEVSLSLTGGWNGDLYAYLSHAGGFSVLLNRSGRSLAQPEGSSSSGLNVVFTDAATLDIHTSLPGSGPVTGMFQPDARNIDPANSLDTSPRSAFLGSFAGLDPNGDWTLFIADMSPGSTSVFQSWSLNITGVPEPSTVMLCAACAMFLLRRRRPSP